MTWEPPKHELQSTPFQKRGVAFQQKNACGHLFSRKHGLGLPILNKMSSILINMTFILVIIYYITLLAIPYSLLPIPYIGKWVRAEIDTCGARHLTSKLQRVPRYVWTAVRSCPPRWHVQDTHPYMYGTGNKARGNRQYLNI